MIGENISKKFRLKNIEETKNYFVEEMNQNELMSNKHRKVFTTCIEHFLILASMVTGCISISAFASLLGTPVTTRSSEIGLKIFALTAEIEKYRSILRKRKRSMIK